MFTLLHLHLQHLLVSNLLPTELLRISGSKYARSYGTESMISLICSARSRYSAVFALIVAFLFSFFSSKYPMNLQIHFPFAPTETKTLNANKQVSWFSKHQ